MTCTAILVPSDSRRHGIAVEVAINGAYKVDIAVEVAIMVGRPRGRGSDP